MAVGECKLGADREPGPAHEGMASGKERGMQLVYKDREYNELGLMDHHPQMWLGSSWRKRRLVLS